MTSRLALVALPLSALALTAMVASPAEAAGGRLHNTSYSDNTITGYSGRGCTGSHVSVRPGDASAGRASYWAAYPSTIHAAGGSTYSVKARTCRSFSSADVYVTVNNPNY